MAINKKLIHFKTKAAYDREKEAGNILDTSIVYVKDAKKIYTHGEEYNGDSYTKAEADSLHDNLRKGITAVLNKVNNNKTETDSDLTAIYNEFDNYQRTLTAGEGIKIENNTISSTLDTSLIRIVTSLPTTGIEINKIYVLPNSSGEGNNIYDEYIYANGAWEKVGSFSSSTGTGKRKVEITVSINADGNIQPQLVTEQMMQDLNDVYENKNAELYLTVIVHDASEIVTYIQYNPLSEQHIDGEGNTTYYLYFNASGAKFIFTKDQHILIPT